MPFWYFATLILQTATLCLVTLEYRSVLSIRSDPIGVAFAIVENSKQNIVIGLPEAGSRTVGCTRVEQTCNVRPAVAHFRRIRFPCRAEQMQDRAVSGSTKHLMKCTPRTRIFGLCQAGITQACMRGLRMRRLLQRSGHRRAKSCVFYLLTGRRRW